MRYFLTTILALVLLVPAGTGLAQRGAPPPQPQPQGARQVMTSAISGVVIDSATQKPIAGAIVQLPNMRQLTDELGRFVVTGLPAGKNYIITASKFGYFDGLYGRSGFVMTANQLRRIVLAEGQWFRDARIELVKHASVSGTVTDETGDPLVGVTVRAYAEIHVAGNRQLAAGPIAVTDDRGMYRIAGVQPGRFYVAVPNVQQAAPADLMVAEGPAATGPADALGREGIVRRDTAFAMDPIHQLVLAPNSPPRAPSVAGRPQLYPTTFYPAARTVTDATAIEVEAGTDRMAVDLQLRPVPGFRVSGRIDAPPEAVAKMTVRLMTAGYENMGRGSEQATALVSGDGSFTFLNVPSGAYTILASRSIVEYAVVNGNASPPAPPGARLASVMSTAVATGPPGTMAVRQTLDGNQRFHGRQSVSVAGRDATGVVVPVQGAIMLSGRVIYESPDGSPAPARAITGVTVVPANGDVSLGQPRSQQDPEEPGYFWIEGIPPGAFLIQMLFGGTPVKSIIWDNKDYSDTPIDTSGGKDIRGVVITVSGQTTIITGTIRNRAGQPASESAALVFPADRARWTNFGLYPTRIVVSAASTGGEYSFNNLPAGDYLIVAIDERYTDRWKDPVFLELASRSAERLSLSLGDRKSQDLTLAEIR